MMSGHGYCTQCSAQSHTWLLPGPSFITHRVRCASTCHAGGMGGHAAAAPVQAAAAEGCSTSDGGQARLGSSNRACMLGEGLVQGGSGILNSSGLKELPSRASMLDAVGSSARDWASSVASPAGCPATGGAGDSPARALPPCGARELAFEVIAESPPAPATVLLGGRGAAVGLAAAASWQGAELAGEGVAAERGEEPGEVAALLDLRLSKAFASSSC
jgi:hypothetical protein